MLVRSFNRSLFTLAVGILCLGIATSSASAGDRVPDDYSVLDQYHETLPDVTGEKDPGKLDETGEKPDVGLPDSTAAELTSAGADGETLAGLVDATAPKAALKTLSSGGGAGAEPAKVDRAGDSSTGKIVKASIGVSGDGGIGILLPLSILLIAVAGVAYLIGKQRSSRSD